MHLEIVDLKLPDLLREVSETVALRAHTKNLELVLELDPGLPRSWRGDPLRLRQILLNLLTNAIKFTDKGEVALVVGRDPEGTGALRFTVEDTGPGIAPQDQGRIFEAFRQADGSTTRRYGGTGLGLTISRQLAELMGGALWVDSQLGVGSQFHLRLPLAPSPGAEWSEPDGLPRAVLLLEDHPRARRVITEMLSSRGVKVLACADGKDAEQALAQGVADFDLSLIDRRFGTEDGLAWARRFADAGLIRNYLLVEADARPSDAELSKSGVRIVMTKPIEGHRLLDTLANQRIPAALQPIPTPAGPGSGAADFVGRRQRGQRHGGHPIFGAGWAPGGPRDHRQTGSRGGPQGSLRRDLDGHPDAGARRLRGHQVDKGARGGPRGPPADHRPDRQRHEGRRRGLLRGGDGRIFGQAHRSTSPGRSGAHLGPTIPSAPSGGVRATTSGSAWHPGAELGHPGPCAE
jgi:CheY-like chemotaxis protein